MPTTPGRVTEPVNIAELERLAFEKLKPGAHGYFAGGAGDERTLRRNAEAFEGWELRPRVLVDVSDVSTRATVARRWTWSCRSWSRPSRFSSSPTADGEAGMARAAARRHRHVPLEPDQHPPGQVAAAAPDGRRSMQSTYSGTAG